MNADLDLGDPHESESAASVDDMDSLQLAVRRLKSQLKGENPEIFYTRFRSIYDEFADILTWKQVSIFCESAIDFAAVDAAVVTEIKTDWILAGLLNFQDIGSLSEKIELFDQLDFLLTNDPPLGRRRHELCGLWWCLHPQRFVDEEHGAEHLKNAWECFQRALYWLGYFNELAFPISYKHMVEVAISFQDWNTAYFCYMKMEQIFDHFPHLHSSKFESIEQIKNRRIQYFERAKDSPSPPRLPPGVL